MTQFTHDGLTIWYGTADSPAPLDDECCSRRGVSVTVAVEPANPSNTVTIRYRVDDGPIQLLRATRQHASGSNSVEYFRATFPDFWQGRRVEYLPIGNCSGLSVPDPKIAATLPSSFCLDASISADRTSSEGSVHQSEGGESTESPRKPFSLEYLASMRIPLQKPEIVGPTPEGLRINWFWYPKEGSVYGPVLNAKVRLLGGDWMTIRRDGIGVMDVRATLETEDGALLYVEYPGYFELGENGYEDALAGKWPAHATTRTTPRFHVADPRYLWLNRLPCLGIGEVNMKALAYEYDIYAVR